MKAGTNLEKILESGRFVVTAEAGPPKGTSAAVGWEDIVTEMV